MKTPKTPATLEKKKLNTPKSGVIAKRKSVNGLTPKSVKKGGIPEFKGSVQALKSLAIDEQNVTPFKNQKGTPAGKAKGAVSPEVELGLKIEAMLEKGVTKSPTNPPSAKKTPRKSMGQTPAKSTPKGIVNGALVTPKNKGTPKVHKETPYPKSSGKGEKVQTKTPEVVKEEEIASPSKKLTNKTPLKPFKLELAAKPEATKTKGSPQKNSPKKGKPGNQQKPGPKTEESAGEPQVGLLKKRKQKQDPSNNTKKSKLSEEKPQPGTQVATESPKKRRTRNNKNTVKAEIPKDLLQNDKLLEVVRAYRTLAKGAKDNDKSLLRGEADQILVQINAFKPPIIPKRLLRITLPNKLIGDNADVAIIVSDVKKADVDGTIDHFEQYFKDNNVTSVNAIIPLKKLVKEYGQFEQKRKLADQYDLFLVEGKITHRITQHLGKNFFLKRKVPIPVTLEQKKVCAKIEASFRKCTICLASYKKSFSTAIGHEELTDEQLAANINELARGLARGFPGGWSNVRSLFLKGAAIHVSLPIFYSAALPNSVPTPIIESKNKKQPPVVDELSTIPGSRVVVYPTGQVRLRKRKAGSDDENENGEEAKTTDQQQKASKVVKNEEEVKDEDVSDEDEEEEVSEDGTEDESQGEGGVKEEDDSEDEDSEEDDESEEKKLMERMKRFMSEEGGENDDDDESDDEDFVGSAEDDLSQDEDDSEDGSEDDNDEEEDDDEEQAQIVKQLTKGRLLKSMRLADEGDEDSDDSDEEIDEDEKMYMDNLNKILDAKENKGKQQNKTTAVKKQPPVKPNNKKVTPDFQNKKNNANKQQLFQANKSKQAVKGGRKPGQNKKGGSPFRNKIK